MNKGRLLAGVVIATLLMAVGLGLAFDHPDDPGDDPDGGCTSGYRVGVQAISECTKLSIRTRTCEGICMSGVSSFCYPSELCNSVVPITVPGSGCPDAPPGEDCRDCVMDAERYGSSTFTIRICG